MWISSLTKHAPLSLAIILDLKKALREMKCATRDEAIETARDLHGRT
jgi:hypothetical protein